MGDDIVESKEVNAFTKDEVADIGSRACNGGNSIAFKCPHCSVNLSSATALASHIKLLHGIKCPLCGIQFNTKGLGNHWRFCNAEAKSQMTRSDTTTYNQCGTDGRAVKQINILKRNRLIGDKRTFKEFRYTGDIKSKTCYKCDLVADSATDLYRHFKSVHSDTLNQRAQIVDSTKDIINKEKPTLPKMKELCKNLSGCLQG